MTDYQDVVQAPRTAFTDPDLKSGSVALSPLGLPMPLSGGFAITYRVATGGRVFAVRCFHREVPGVTDRYGRISSRLRALASPYFVAFDYQPRGVLVNGSHYPIVKMDWVEGLTLDGFLDRHSGKPSEVKALRAKFQHLQGYLEASGVAHGDLQNGNVLVQGSDIRLIDYDGMFVEGMARGAGTEVGHKHFQHPSRGTKDFGPLMDRFSFLVMDVSLQAVAQIPDLYRKFREGGEAIVFKANDFLDNHASEVFKTLRATSELREAADKFARVCGGSADQVPTVEDFLAGKNIPSAVVRSASAPVRPAPTHAYVGAYPVLSAADFPSVLARVGDRIELVGRVVSVFEGVGRRGRGRGRPYVFVNFGLWNGQSVKVTIWSEGLSGLSTPPNQTWVGKWLSVTGLIEPPYNGQRYGRAYTNVGITVTSDNQIVQLTEKDARFRMGKPSDDGDAPGTNAELLASLSRAGSRPRSTGRRTAPSAPVRPSPSLTPNQRVLAELKPASPSGGRPGGQVTPQPMRQPAGIPAWIWIGGVLLLLWLVAAIGSRH